MSTEDLSAHLDSAWEAEETDHTSATGAVVYKDKHGALFTMRRFGENGNQVGRQPYAAPTAGDKKRAAKHEETT